MQPQPKPTEAFGIEAATAEMKRANDTVERFTASGGQVDRAVTTFEKFTASVQKIADKQIPSAAEAGAGAGGGLILVLLLRFLIRLVLLWLKKRFSETPSTGG